MAAIYKAPLSQGLDAIQVPDTIIPNSKAGLYVYLSSLLVGRPMVDDASLLQFLRNRYGNDPQTASVNLITSSFDVLASAISSHSSGGSTFLLRSYLINKVPLLLVQLSHDMFLGSNMELCITDALLHVDTTVFPTFSSMFDNDMSGGSGSGEGDSVRQDFVFACCLHGLIPQASIEQLLGEIPMQSLPAAGRYSKELIVEGCMADQEKIPTFVEELEHMDGNVGAVAEAIVAVVQHLCEVKDTSILRNVCAQLARKPASLDTLLLFEKPAKILQPVCKLLDEWHYDGDEGEYQPVYEDFGCILLLVLSLSHRFNLCAPEMGITSPTSFVASLLVRGSLASPLDQLNPEQAKRIGGWITGLFATESGGGLGDEPMANCEPQDFYLLVPTLFEQVLLAYTHNYLSEEALRTSLEYLVDTFLLPSLVGALGWIASYIWASAKPTHDNSSHTRHVLTLLSILLSPPSISAQAQQMHSSILPLVASDITAALAYLQSCEPANPAITPLMGILSPHTSQTSTRTASATLTEMESWTNSSHGGLVGSTRQLIKSLVHWSLQSQNPPTSGEHVVMPSYTHKQVLFALKMLGAKRMLEVLLEEIPGDNEGLAYDVVASLVASPLQGDGGVEQKAASGGHELDPVTGELDSAENNSTAPAIQGRISLRQCLHFEMEDINALLTTTDAPRAQKLVRLWRRVEGLLRQPAQVHQTQAADAMMGQQFGHAQMQTGIGNGIGGGMMGGVGQMPGLQGMDVGMSTGFTPEGFDGMKLDF